VIIIQVYKLKRGFKPEIDRIREVIETNFPVPVTEENGKLVISYGALKRIEAWIDNKKLCVETESNPDASDETVLETNKLFRKFLDEATGYTSKQRVKTAKKEIEG
jgi:hypothetical protein